MLRNRVISYVFAHIDQRSSFRNQIHDAARNQSIKDDHLRFLY